MLAVYYLGNKLIELKARETVIVPVSNTSSELLCRYLAERLIGNFTNVEQGRFNSLSIFIEECYGQHARYTHEFKS